MVIYMINMNSMVLDKSYFLQFLSRNEIDHVSQYKQEKDQLRSILGIVLAKYGYYQAWKIGKVNVELSYTQHGQPYIEGSDRYISISHSNMWICSVNSNQPIGVDIQEKDSAWKDFYYRYLAKSEVDHLQHLKECDKKHYVHMIWCMKESILKYKGVGLLEDPRMIELKEVSDGLYYHWHIYETQLGQSVVARQIHNDYYLALYTSQCTLCPDINIVNEMNLMKVMRGLYEH